MSRPDSRSTAPPLPRKRRGNGAEPGRRAQPERVEVPQRTFPALFPTADGEVRLVRLKAPQVLSVPRRLQLDGLAGYEPETLACFLAVCDIASDGPVWDVGANVGVYALLAALATTREIVAFEPTKQTATVARRWLRRNTPTAQVHRMALGEQDGVVTLFLSTSSDSSNSTAAGFRESQRSVEVPQRSIDSLLAEGMTPPAVLKLDTETTEPGILAGATECIAQHRPWILCEALPGRSEEQLMAQMRPHGYTWHLIAEETPFPARERIEGDPSLYMWLFAPAPIPDRLWQRIAEWRRTLSECTPAAARERRAAQKAAQ